MPEDVEREIERRGGALRWRTLKLPDGRYLRVAVTREPGPRGGRTVAGEPRKPKMAEGGLGLGPRRSDALKNAAAAEIEAADAELKAAYEQVVTLAEGEEGVAKKDARIIAARERLNRAYDLWDAAVAEAAREEGRM
jgi:hypothetical protein